MKHLPIALSLAFALCTEASAQLHLANSFGDHMVLQRDIGARVWGTATPGETVAIAFAGKSATATAAKHGRWIATLPPMPANAEGRELVVTGSSDSVRIRDVLVGDVWVCGGQSNMAWTMSGSRDADIEIDSADTPQVRYLRMPQVARAEPQTDFPVANPTHKVGNWRLCTPEQVEACTAVGYYFARRLHRRLRIPIGIIDTSWGGTMAQHWCSKATLRTFATMDSYFATYETKRKEWIDGGKEEGASRRYEADVATWQKARDAAKASGEREPRRPNKRNYENPGDQGHPGAMFNGVIEPIKNTALRGVVFYQGENNSFGETWKPFSSTFPAVIRDWRKAFAVSDLPFCNIQIAGWSTRRTMTYDMNHHTNIIREVQLDTWQNTENTGLIVTYDCNSNGSIHPGRKLPVGERTARWALAEVYGTTDRRNKRPIEWRGPLYEGMRIVDNKIFVSFVKETARGLRLNKDVAFGFYVAGEDMTFHHASARIHGKTSEVEIWCDAVKQPVAARYGWSNLPAGTLLNGRELPAYPFRTDNWPMEPHQSTGSYVRGK
jgi:sialate O-acetylesterase